MKPFLTIPVAVAFSFVLAAPATSLLAQTAPAAQQPERAQNADRPDGGQAGGGMMNGGMMGGDMMGGDIGRMMSMMRGGGGMMGGMPFQHVEGRLAFLKTELKITDAQAPQWNKFAEAVRSVAESVKVVRQQMMQGGQTTQAGQSAAARLDRYERMLSARLEAVRTVRAAFDPLYASLSDDQKKSADELVGRMSMM